MTINTTRVVFGGFDPDSTRRNTRARGLQVPSDIGVQTLPPHRGAPCRLQSDPQRVLPRPTVVVRRLHRRQRARSPVQGATGLAAAGRGTGAVRLPERRPRHARGDEETHPSPSELSAVRDLAVPERLSRLQAPPLPVLLRQAADRRVQAHRRRSKMWSRNCSLAFRHSAAFTSSLHMPMCQMTSPCG